ncbi:amidase signature enzyme [Pseudovirgaria hyperparasitica]|uniref:Amidase signature enzyme n=1 Tax=Pseudovirgaria hyperparasitica TaxID=470096 RepID=A0A6A6W8S9_9PEZI|nr:amidase signature enzyme [Pseudovirgaria hyperparasitica]KAF2758609.1 amidase signature enzyme [Pseudovirgaria hyperparasitica]
MSNAPDSLGYPVAKATEVEYKSPKAASNPIVRGLPLSIGASIIASSSILQNYLWTNAGFDVLRSIPQLRDFSARHDPTVTPIASTAAPQVTSNFANADGLREPPGDIKHRFYSVLDYHKAYLAGTLTPTAVAQSLLPLIRKDVASPTKHSIAFIDTKVELVLKAAEASTLRYKEGKPLGVLDGVPVAVKDEVELSGYRTTLGSVRDYTNKDGLTSSCIEKWIEHGAVVIGKTNMHEIGMDTTNNNPNWGTPRNPYNENYYTGGSSGGSGYCVGKGLIPIAHGVDGGGSVRLPASFCGAFGLKPSHSRVSSYPTGTSSVTVSGPIAANMVDLEVAFRVMAAPDPHGNLNASFPLAYPSQQPRKKILGVYKPWSDRAEESVRLACQRAVDWYITRLGYEVVDINIPYVHEGQTAHAMTILNEQLSDFPDISFLTAPNKLLLSVASKTPATDFVLAQKMRNLLMQHLASLFKTYPDMIIVTPTTPKAGWHIEAEGDLKHGVTDANQTLQNMEYVWLANFCGLPGLTFPVGYAEPKGGEGRVPIGLMGQAVWNNENALIEWGYEGERYIAEALEGGRQIPNDWVDVFALESPSE